MTRPWPSNARCQLSGCIVKSQPRWGCGPPDSSEEPSDHPSVLAWRTTATLLAEAIMIDRNIANPVSGRYPQYQPPDSRLVSADDNHRQVGGLVVVSGLLREMGDPTEILRNAELRRAHLIMWKPDSKCVGWTIYLTNARWRRAPRSARYAVGCPSTERSRSIRDAPLARRDSGLRQDLRRCSIYNRC